MNTLVACSSGTWNGLQMPSVFLSPWSIPVPPSSPLIGCIFPFLSQPSQTKECPQASSYQKVFQSIVQSLEFLPFHWGLEFWNKNKDGFLSVFCCVFPTLMQGMWSAHLTGWEKGQKDTIGTKLNQVLFQQHHTTNIVSKAWSGFETPVTQPRWLAT